MKHNATTLRNARAASHVARARQAVAFLARCPGGMLGDRLTQVGYDRELMDALVASGHVHAVVGRFASARLEVLTATRYFV
jgi:hypothetical protein